MKKNTIIFILVILTILSALSTIYLLAYSKIISDQDKLKQSCNNDNGINDYQLLSSDIAWLNVNDFWIRQRQTTASYDDLKKSVSIILQNAEGDYAFYFEDLTTGAYIGINENEPFMPLSLYKVPVMIAALKEIELGELSLDKKIVLTGPDIDNRSGQLWMKGVGYETNVKELLIELIQHSDNTASLALMNHVISDQTFSESILAAGLPDSL